MKAPACYLVAAFLALPSLFVTQARPPNALLPRTPQGLLALLAGTWHFDAYSQGSTAPVASGQREMRLLADSMKLTWTETFARQSDIGTGVLGYNSLISAYYVLGWYTNEPNPLVLSGLPDSSGRVVSFDATGGMMMPGTFIPTELRLVDHNHFEWVASDRSWRTLFTRLPHS